MNKLNYKEIVDYLNTLITSKHGIKWYRFELNQWYSGKEAITTIHLVDFGCDNKYRVYHSELDDEIGSMEELIKHCMDELRTVWNDINSVMSGIIKNSEDNINCSTEISHTIDDNIINSEPKQKRVKVIRNGRVYTNDEKFVYDNISTSIHNTDVTFEDYLNFEKGYLPMNGTEGFIKFKGDNCSYKKGIQKCIVGTNDGKIFIIGEDGLEFL